MRAVSGGKKMGTFRQAGKGWASRSSKLKFRPWLEIKKALRRH